MSGNLGKGPEPWELKNMGSTVQDRTVSVAQDVRLYRDTVGIDSNHETQKAHNKYIHTTGADMLRLQTTKTLLSNKEEKLNKKLRGKPKLPQKTVKVDLLDEDGFTIALDLEWDTSTWGNSEIEAGTEALISVFDKQVGPERRRQAVRMLSKMLERHAMAERTLQAAIGPIMHRAMSRRVKGGKVLAALNLLFVLHTGMSRFFYEISSNNYMDQFWSMVLVEAKLAATIIQHAYRTHREIRYTRYAPVGQYAQGWSTQEEVIEKRIKSLLVRGGELRTQWAMLHFYQSAQDKRQIYGVKGPVHVPIVYLKTGLEICDYLISVRAKEHVHLNRDDCLFVNSEILLIGFLSSPAGEMSQRALSILNSVALNESSLRPFIRAGILRAVVKYIKYQRGKCGDDLMKSLVLVAISLVTRLARHCAGLHRARGGYDFVEKQDYCDDTIQSEVHYKNLYLSYKNQEFDDYRKLLFDKKLSSELVNMFYSYSSIQVKKDILLCFLALSGSVCFTVVFEEVTRLNGQLLKALIDLFEYEKGEEMALGDLSLALLIQLATYDPCRAGMRSSNILGMLRPLMEEEAYFPRVSYKRASFLLIALCRVGEWRSYIPSLLLRDVRDPRSLVHITYMDMMKTIKQPPVDSKMKFDELIALETNEPMAEELANLAQETACRDIVDFYTCPMSNFHFSSLPFEIAFAGCSILSAIVSKPQNARSCLSKHLVRYLGQCMHWAFSEISTKVNSAKQGEVLLCSVSACTSSLVNICDVGVENKKDCENMFLGLHESQASDAAKYFMTVFSNSENDKLPEKFRKLQDRVSLDCIKLMEKYAGALLLLKTPESDQGLEDLANTVGGAACTVISELPRIMGRSPKATRVLDALCQLLSKLVATSAGRFLAFKSWKLCDALLLHLPEPLCVPGDVMEEAVLYKGGIRDLPSSVFDVMSRLCQTDQGLAISISDGYLRRALDKVSLVSNLLESEEEMHQIAIAIEKGKPPPKNKLRLELASSLQLIAKCANFHNAKFGSANDLILIPKFSIVQVCCQIISQVACPRNDEAYLASLSVLRQLSKDAIHIYDLFRDFEIMPMIHNEIKRVNEIPLEGVADCVDLIYNVSVGLRGAHLRAELPRMREALARVGRVYIRLGQAVSDSLYSISRNHGKFLDDNDGEVREGPVVTGGTDEMKELMALSTKEERESFIRSGKPGTYERCGVSTCGGLGVPGGTCGHCNFLESDPTTQSKKMDLLVLANTTSDTCYLTKLSARNKKFHTDLILKKEAQGYIELSDEEFKKLKLPIVSPPGSASRKTAPVSSDMWSPVRTTTKQSSREDGARKKQTAKIKNKKEFKTIDVSELPELMSTRPARPPPRL